MKKYVKYLKYIIPILILLLVFGVMQHSINVQKQRNIDNLKAAIDSTEMYKKLYNGALHTIGIKDALILTERDAKQAAILDAKELRKLHIKDVVTQSGLNTTINILKDSLKAKPGTEIIYIKDSINNSTSVKLPFEYESPKDKYSYLRSGIGLNKQPYINAEIYLEGKLIIGFQKDGLFKTKPVGVFTTENPYVTRVNITPVIIQKNTEWYEKWWVHVLGGAIGGAAIMYKLVK